jgi:hypothetical protein
MSKYGAQTYSLISTYGVYDRDFRKELGMRYPRASAFGWMRAVPGRMKKEQGKNHEFYYWEEDNWYNAACTIAAIDTGTSNTVKVTLSTADHFNSGTTSYPIVGEIATFQNEDQGLVTAINRTVANAHVVTIVDLNASTDVQTSAVVGQTVVFGSNAQTEESGVTEFRHPTQTKQTFKAQTFRKDYKVTDHEEQNQVEFEYQGQKYLWVKGADEMADQFEANEEFGLLTNKLSASLTNAASKAVQTAEGLIPQIDNYGQKAEYFDAPDINDFADYVLILQKNFGDTQYLAGIGINADVKLQQSIKQFEAESPHVFFSNMDSKQSLAFNFKDITYSDYQFKWQKWEALSHPSSSGATGMPYPDMMIFIPAGDTIDPTTMDKTPYLTLRYFNPGGAPNENKGDYKLWETGANARSGATSTDMNRVISMYSVKSLVAMARHKYLIVRKG